MDPENEHDVLQGEQANSEAVNGEYNKTDGYHVDFGEPVKQAQHAFSVGSQHFSTRLEMGISHFDHFGRIR